VLEARLQPTRKFKHRAAAAALKENGTPTLDSRIEMTDIRVAVIIRDLRKWLTCVRSVEIVHAAGTLALAR
jgi:hypothetical protein